MVAPYVDIIARKAVEEGFAGMRFVDIGCGDFRVGCRLLNLCSSYVGVDIVRPLIELNKAKYGRPGVDFVQLNVISDEPPDGNVCFVRQVFQHLSNEQISSVLPKLKKYRWVFITEHYPDGFHSKSPNIDKIHGADVRFYYDSGVYLSEPPFCLPADSLEFLLEVPVKSVGGGGVLRTYLYRPC
jgi:hypothetical protein